MSAGRTRAATMTHPPRARESVFWRKYHRRRYAILFYTLLLTLLVIPIATTLGLHPLIPKVLIGFALCAAVMPSAQKRTRLALFICVLLLVSARIGSDEGYVPVNGGLLLAAVGFTGLLATAKTLEFVVKSKSVTSETLYAALSTYLLAGIFFGQIFWSLELMHEGSLIGPDPVTDAVTLYYSFITLATLGYGDFVPRTDIARGVASFEVISGQLFLAVMIARLIGVFVPQRKAERSIPQPAETEASSSHSPGGLRATPGKARSRPQAPQRL
jgi:FtsH-binding integral membrane protein